MSRFCIKAALIVLLPITVNFSQKISDISVLISANLTKEQYIQLPGNLNFDKINSTHSSGIISRDPDKGIKVKIEGRPDKSIVLTYSPIKINNFQWASENDRAKGTISFTPEIECTYTNSHYSKPVILKSGSSFIFPDDGRDGLLCLWIGGKIQIAGKQPPGNYSGIFQIKVSYE
ncbi:MAG: DUF4402 domain-containing protein [Ignavibacteriaceae bacterium]